MFEFEFRIFSPDYAKPVWCWGGRGIRTKSIVSSHFWHPCSQEIKLSDKTDCTLGQLFWIAHHRLLWSWCGYFFITYRQAPWVLLNKTGIGHRCQLQQSVMPFSSPHTVQMKTKYVALDGSDTSDKLRDRIVSRWSWIVHCRLKGGNYINPGLDRLYVFCHTVPYGIRNNQLNCQLTQLSNILQVEVGSLRRNSVCWRSTASNDQLWSLCRELPLHP